MVHELKTWPEPFQALVDGNKTYEIRKNDRNYQVGDVLILREWLPESKEYTKRCIISIITYMTEGGCWGLPTEVCVLAVKKLAYGQSVYNWMAGENPSHESAEKLDDLARAADLFAAEGFSTSSYLFRRKLEGGKTLMDVVREGGSAQDAARLLLQVAQKETVQREALQRRLAKRTPSAPDYSDVGSPMLNLSSTKEDQNVR